MKQRKLQPPPEVQVTPQRVAREKAIHDSYNNGPSLRELYERGEIDKETYEAAKRLLEAGPPRWYLRWN